MRAVHTRDRELESGQPACYRILHCPPKRSSSSSARGTSRSRGIDVSYCQNGVLWPAYDASGGINTRALEAWARPQRALRLPLRQLAVLRPARPVRTLRGDQPGQLGGEAGPSGGVSLRRAPRRASCRRTSSPPRAGCRPRRRRASTGSARPFYSPASSVSSGDSPFSSSSVAGSERMRTRIASTVSVTSASSPERSSMTASAPW